MYIVVCYLRARHCHTSGVYLFNNEFVYVYDDTIYDLLEILHEECVAHLPIPRMLQSCTLFFGVA